MRHSAEKKAGVRVLRAGARGKVREGHVVRRRTAPAPEFEAREAPLWGPAQLVQMHLGFAPARILSTALELDVFSHLAQERYSAKQVSAAAGASERGMRMVLDALVGLGFLVKSGNRYGLTEPARRFFVREIGRAHV